MQFGAVTLSLASTSGASTGCKLKKLKADAPLVETIQENNIFNDKVSTFYADWRPKFISRTFERLKDKRKRCIKKEEGKRGKGDGK